MQRLDPKSFFIFYFAALRNVFILVLVSIPVMIFISVPAYFASSLVGKEYLFSRFLFSYTLLSVCVFSFIPFLWGYLAYLMTHVEMNKSHIAIIKGTIFRKVIDLPYSHIQSIRILKEPMLEILGLCSIEIEMTDQTDKKSLKLPGLSIEQAHYVRALYLENSEAI